MKIRKQPLTNEEIKQLERVEGYISVEYAKRLQVDLP